MYSITPVTTSVDTVAIRNKSSQNTLLHKHMDYFVERGILLAWASANARSVTAKEATELLGYPVKSDGIWFEGANGVVQFRPDTRWKNNKGKLVGKFLSPSRTVCEIDIFIPNHPTDASYWETENLKKACYQINNHPHIVTTEGPAKAIAGCAKGIPTVAVSGVDNGLTGSKKDPEGKRFLVPTLRKLAEAGLGIIIGYDADVATNPSVATAERTLAAQLGKFKVPVRSVTGKWAKEIEGKDTKGMDDFIHHRGIEEFRAILSKAKLFGEGENNSESLDKGDKKKGKQLPPPSEVAAELGESYRDKLAWESEYQLWRRYSGKCDGVWAVETTETVRGIIHGYLRSQNLSFNAGFVSSVEKIMQSDLEAIEWNEQNGLIPLRDGVLDIKTQQLLPHAPGYRFTWQLPYKWSDRSIGCEPIERFLLNITGNQAVAEVLLAFLAAIITRRADLQRYLELIGGGGTGKSTYMALARALAGADNTVSSQLRLLESNQFETARFYGKLLALFPDSERWQGEVSVFKQLTGGDPVRYERKGVQQCKDFRFNGMVMLSANEPPESKDKTSGLERRKLTVSLTRRIPEYEGRNLIEEFTPYLPGLLKRVLDIRFDEVTRLIKFTDKEVPALRDSKWEQMLVTNDIARWLDDKAVLDPGLVTYVGTNDEAKAGSWLYASYCVDRQEQNEKPISMKAFRPNLMDFLLNQLKVQVTAGENRKGRFIQGIGLRCHLDPTGEIYPRPVTKKPFGGGGLMVDCGGYVVAETIGSGGWDGCDGLIEDSKNTINIQPTTLPTSNQNQNCDGDGENNPQHPPNPPLVGTLPVTQPSQDKKNPPQRPETHANQRRAHGLADEMREAVAEGDREKAKEVMRLFEASTPQIRGFFNKNLTPQEKNAASLLLKYGFTKGTQVRYVGTDLDLKEQYGDLTLVIDSHNDHKKPLITCLKPDGSFTTWLKSEDLRKL
jgi:putative DNA primase/helicase